MRSAVVYVFMFLYVLDEISWGLRLYRKLKNLNRISNKNFYIKI